MDIYGIGDSFLTGQAKKYVVLWQEAHHDHDVTVHHQYISEKAQNCCTEPMDPGK